MKKTILTIFVLACISTMAMAQQTQKKLKLQPPTAVLNAFTKQHANIKVKWEKEGENYEADFRLNNTKMTQTYKPNGELIETETAILISHLPEAIATYVKKNKLGKIKEASKIELADGTIQYEADLPAGDYLFDASGNFIKIEKD